MCYNDRMKIFISGADGALGTAMQEILRREKIGFAATDANQLDITDFKKVNEYLLNHRPDVILHLAAISNVDDCEEHKEMAFRVNALGCLGMAIAARKIASKILYVSTNFVFDGRGEKPYHEYSAPNPVNEYGSTKLLGEKYIREVCDRFYIVRTSWLFGRNSKTFISRFLGAEPKPPSINAICDQHGSFTYLPDLAEAILQLVKSDNFGIYHIVNSQVATWCDFALKAKDIMRFKTEINPVKTDELGLAAARPVYAPLASHSFEFLFGRPVRPWHEALIEYIKTIRQPANAQA